tara:strand:- start:79 stop:438 length:360 start_codon:yes stop_codon:yes gene_type:complete
MSKLYTLNTESVFKINYDSNRYKEIENYKKEIKILVQKNVTLQKNYKSMEDMKLTMSCIYLLNKILITLMIFYILTAKSHSSTKVIDQGFSFFDWICFFICNISLSTSFPKLVNWISKK